MRQEAIIGLGIIIFFVLLCNGVPGDETLFALISIIIAAVTALQQDKNLPHESGPTMNAEGPINDQIRKDRVKADADAEAETKQTLRKEEPVVIDVEPDDD